MLSFEIVKALVLPALKTQAGSGWVGLKEKNSRYNHLKKLLETTHTFTTKMPFLGLYSVHAYWQYQPISERLWDQFLSSDSKSWAISFSSSSSLAALPTRSVFSLGLTILPPLNLHVLRLELALTLKCMQKLYSATLKLRLKFCHACHTCSTLCDITDVGGLK